MTILTQQLRKRYKRGDLGRLFQFLIESIELIRKNPLSSRSASLFGQFSKKNAETWTLNGSDTYLVDPSFVVSKKVQKRRIDVAACPRV